jgi:pyruvate formate lyase activating enzyme
MGEGLIFDIKRYSIHDGPGIRTTVFLKGCPLDCWWCHNPVGRGADRPIVVNPALGLRCARCAAACPEGLLDGGDPGRAAPPERCLGDDLCVAACPSGARRRIGRRVEAAALLEEILADAPFFDESGGGVTFSGGEPLLQPEFLAEMLDACGERDLHRAVDTSGQAAPAVLRAIAGRAELFLYDLKLMDPERHRRYTGRDNGRILDNLRLLDALGKPVELRLPVIPGINDGDADIAAAGAFAARLGNLTAVTLLPFHAPAMDKYARLGYTRRLPETLPPARETLEGFAGLLASFGLPVRIGGGRDE